MAALQNQKSAAEQQVSAARAQLSQIQSDKERIETERDSLNLATVELKSQREALTRSVSDLESERDRVRAESDRLRAESDELRSDKERLARGIILNLPDILFDVNKATLKRELKTAVDKLAGILLIMSELRVRIEGHTDSTGSEEYNLKLSTERSQGVLAFLGGEGIDESRMTAVGYGLTRPIAGNDTREGRRKNRRVEIIISDKEIGEE